MVKRFRARRTKIHNAEDFPIVVLVQPCVLIMGAHVPLICIKHAIIAWMS